MANVEYRILDEANRARASEMGDTLRQLLAARQSQELHSQANRVATVALWVSIVAIVVSVVQWVAGMTRK